MRGPFFVDRDAGPLAGFCRREVMHDDTLAAGDFLLLPGFGLQGADQSPGWTGAGQKCRGHSAFSQMADFPPLPSISTNCPLLFAGPRQGPGVDDQLPAIAVAAGAEIDQRDQGE